jgi:hypothetical protein
VTTTIVSAIKGTMMRTIKLDVCGNPVSGGSGVLIAEPGFISVKPNPTYEDGTEFVQKLASGLLCVNQKDQGQLKRVALDVLLCVLNPDIIVQLTGSRENFAGGVTGSGVFFNDTVVSTHTSLELWQTVAGRNACVNGVQQYVYWVFAHTVNWQVGAWAVENATLQFNLKGETQGAGAWGTLPTVLPPNGYLTPGTFQAGDHYAYNVTTVAPPASTNGAVVLV